MASKPQKARQIGKQKLLDLVKLTQNTNARLAEERGALGAKYEQAATADNFNAKALRPLLPLLKMDPGPQAHLWRTIMLYADHLGIGAQSDLEDYAAGAEATDENGEGGDAEDEAEDGDETDDQAERRAEARALADEQSGGGEADPVDSVLAGMVTPELGRFRTALQDCATPEAVNRGLERFTTDHGDMAEQALEMAQARLNEIGAEAGGGEDLRSTAARNAEAQSAADTTHASTGKKPRRPRASTRKDAGKIGQGAKPPQEEAGSNLRGEFGGGRPGAPLH